MIDKLNEHREATCNRQNVAWEDTIKKRLETEKSPKTGENTNEEKSPKKTDIPIVIWGLEASPSYFDVNNNERKIGYNKLHENYLYNEVNENDKNYGVMLIKKWIYNGFKGDYNYTNKIDVLSNANFNLYPLDSDYDDIIAVDAIHLVYDIFPEWHGLKVSPYLRNACFNEHYMCEKIPDFEKHLMLIKSIFRWYSDKFTQGTIHFVWLATQQGKVKERPMAHEKFFECIRIFDKEIQLYYNPKGFVTNSNLEAWPDCPGDFEDS
jgi:hypothetical protein